MPYPILYIPQVSWLYWATIESGQLVHKKKRAIFETTCCGTSNKKSWSGEADVKGIRSSELSRGLGYFYVSTSKDATFLLKHGSFRQRNCKTSQFLQKKAKKFIWNLALPAWVTKQARPWSHVSHPLTSPEEHWIGWAGHTLPLTPRWCYHHSCSSAVQTSARQLEKWEATIVAGRQLPHNFFFPFILSTSDAAHSQTRYLPFK